MALRGKTGEKVKMRLRGNADFVGNTLLWGQDGGRGGHGTDTQASDVNATGATGEMAGRSRYSSPATLTYSGAENVIRSGSGGWGGDANCHSPRE